MAFKVGAKWFFIERQHATHAQRDTVMANLSVCLSVCLFVHLSNACIVCKWMDIAYRQTFSTVWYSGYDSGIILVSFEPHRRTKCPCFNITV